jgi:hypothetical protein
MDKFTFPMSIAKEHGLDLFERTGKLGLQKQMANLVQCRPLARARFPAASRHYLSLPAIEKTFPALTLEFSVVA